MNGVTIAFTSYGIAAVISFLTAGLMVLIIKAMQLFAKK